MSRAFVKDDAPEGPPIIPPRAPLPEGVPNYVTPRGLAMLRAERKTLEAERKRLSAAKGERAERQRQLAVVGGRLADLLERLSRTKLIDLRDQAPDTVRFGATVTVQAESGEERRIQIVGVDEAEMEEGRVAFTAPIARAITGKDVGETVTLHTPHGEERLVILSIVYEAS